METTSFSVPSISCGACSAKIESGLKSLNGIENVKVDLSTKTVDVKYNPDEIQPLDIRRKVSSLGYEVVM